MLESLRRAVIDYILVIYSITTDDLRSEFISLLHRSVVRWLSKPHDLIMFFSNQFICGIRFQEIVHYLTVRCKLVPPLAFSSWVEKSLSLWLKRLASTWKWGGATWLPFHWCSSCPTPVWTMLGKKRCIWLCKSLGCWFPYRFESILRF